MPSPLRAALAVGVLTALLATGCTSDDAATSTGDTDAATQSTSPPESGPSATTAAEPIDLALHQLRPGLCVADWPEPEPVESVGVIDCASDHVGEVVWRAQLRAPDVVRTQEELDDAATLDCEAVAESYLGRPLADSPYAVRHALWSPSHVGGRGRPPSHPGHDDGHTLICVVVHAEGTPLRGSVRGG